MLGIGSFVRNFHIGFDPDYECLLCYFFVSEVVFIKMPSRQEKKRAKRREKYLQVRDDVLELGYLGMKKKLRKQVNKNILYEKVGGI